MSFMPVCCKFLILCAHRGYLKLSAISGRRPDEFQSDPSFSAHIAFMNTLYIAVYVFLPVSFISFKHED